LIYCVEDEENIRELIVYALKAAGFSAKGFESGREFFAALENDLPRLVLLDIMLPGEDGLSILNKLKKDARTQAIPVIMLTAKDTEMDKVQGLDLGADDYIAKPFGMMEFLARVRAVLRRSEKSTGQDLCYKEIRIDARSHRVYSSGSEITLTLKEYQLLEYMLTNVGIALSREQISDAIWGYDFAGGTRTIDAHIKTLRQKLQAAGQYIETVRGLGYRIGG